MRRNDDIAARGHSVYTSVHSHTGIVLADALAARFHVGVATGSLSSLADLSLFVVALTALSNERMVVQTGQWAMCLRALPVPGEYVNSSLEEIVLVLTHVPYAFPSYCDPRSRRTASGLSFLSTSAP